MVQIALVAQQQDSVVRGQLELGQLLQIISGLLEAGLITDGVHHDERVTPAKMLVQATSFLSKIERKDTQMTLNIIERIKGTYITFGCVQDLHLGCNIVVDDSVSVDEICGKKM